MNPFWVVWLIVMTVAFLSWCIGRLRYDALYLTYGVGWTCALVVDTCTGAPWWARLVDLILAAKTLGEWWHNDQGRRRRKRAARALGYKARAALARLRIAPAHA